MAVPPGPESSPDHRGSPWVLEQADQEDGGPRLPNRTELLLRTPNETVEVSRSMVQEITALPRKVRLHTEGYMEDSPRRTAEAFLEEIVGRFPDELPWDEYDHATFTIDLEREIGREKVASRIEMRKRGLITAEDERLLDDEALAEAVRQANISGTLLEKSQVVDESYLRGYRGAVRLALRGDSGKSVVPVYRVPLQPTTELFVVVVIEQDEDKTVHKRLRKLVPGRKMPRLPSDPRFHAKEDVEGMDRKVSVHDLRERLTVGDALTSGEERLVIEQNWAQARWWECGFLSPDADRENVARFERSPLVAVIGPPGYTEDYLDRKVPDLHQGVDWTDSSSKQKALDSAKRKLRQGEPVFMRVFTGNHRRVLARLARETEVPAEAMLITVPERGWDLCARELAGKHPVGTWRSYVSAHENLLERASYASEGFSVLRQMTPKQAEQIDRFEFA